MTDKLITDKPGLVDERDAVLERIRQLDQEHAAGLLTDEEYSSLRDEHTLRAAKLIREINSVPEQRSAVATRFSGQFPGRRNLWIAGIAIFVLLTGGVLTTAINDRLSSDEVTGASSDDPNTLLRAAQEYTARGNGVKAIKTYDKVLKIQPDNVQALAYRGWLIRLAGLPNEGLQSIDRAIAAQPTYPDARFFKGFILLRDQNKPAEAIPEFEAFLANNPPQGMVPMVEGALADAQALVNTPR